MLSALLLLSPGASAQQTVCATGFIMDTFCIQPGTLLDNNAARSLIDGEGPQKHSYHCLLDVPQCLDGGFEMLEVGGRVGNRVGDRGCSGTMGKKRVGMAHYTP